MAVGLKGLKSMLLHSVFFTCYIVFITLLLQANGFVPGTTAMNVGNQPPSCVRNVIILTAVNMFKATLPSSYLD